MACVSYKKYLIKKTENVHNIFFFYYNPSFILYTFICIKNYIVGIINQII